MRGARCRSIPHHPGGQGSIVTDRIASFTETGILLESGTELEADIIVTATGLNIKIIGGIELTVDGEPVSLPDTVVYRGIMLSGVPNFALAIGYTNASWTLKIGLLCQYFCKLLGYMDSHGHDAVWAVATRTCPLVRCSTSAPATSSVLSTPCRNRDHAHRG